MNERFNFSDEPIKDFADDLLERKHFVREITEILAATNPELSLVVGLNAKWGEGKTSVVNLLCPELRKSGFEIVRFNPWEWSSGADLAETFLDEVGLALGARSRRKARDLAKAWHRYSARLKSAAEAGGLLLPIVKVALLASLLSSLSFSLIVAKSLALVLTIIATAGIAWLAQFFPAVVDMIFPDSDDDSVSLESLKEKVRRKAKASERRILIVLDDVDRLAPEETAAVIKLVKANGDIPRVSYLIVGDRAVIAKHLRIALRVDGIKYLEKIVQLSFNLPLAEQSTLNKVLFSAIDAMIAPKMVMSRWEQTRWVEVFQYGIEPMIGDLRSVKKFAASLDLHFRLLKGQYAFEANPVDLIATECIRVFYPALFIALRENKKFLTEAPDKEKLRNEQVIYKEIMASGNSKDSNKIRSLLHCLFPLLASYESSFGSVSARWKDWASTRRICSPSYFDRYFMFRPSSSDFSDSEAETLLTLIDREEVVIRLMNYCDAGRIEQVLQKIRQRIKDIPKSGILPMVVAICDVSDRLSGVKEQMFGVSVLDIAEVAVDELLREMSEEERIAALETIFSLSEGIKVPIEYLRRLQQHEHEGRLELPLKSNQLLAWSCLMANGLRERAEDGRFWGLEQANLYLHLWSRWGSQEEVRKFVSQFVRSRENALTFLRGMLQTLHSTRPNKHGGTGHHYILYAQINEFINPEIVLQKLDIVDAADREKLVTEHPVVRLLENAIRRHERGISEDGMPGWVEDEED